MSTLNDAAVEAAKKGVADRLSWASMYWGTEKVDPDAWDPIIKAALTAALPQLRKDWEAPDDAALDSLVTLIRDAARGGCGSHDGCRALVRTHQRNAARRWFIDRTPEATP